MNAFDTACTCLVTLEVSCNASNTYDWLSLYFLTMFLPPVLQPDWMAVTVLFTIGESSQLIARIPLYLFFRLMLWDLFSPSVAVFCEARGIECPFCRGRWTWRIVSHMLPCNDRLQQHHHLAQSHYSDTRPERTRSHPECVRLDFEPAPPISPPCCGGWRPNYSATYRYRTS